MKVTLLALWLLTAAEGPSSALQTVAERTARIVLDAKPELPLALAVDAPTSALGRAYSGALASKLTHAGLPIEVIPTSPQLENVAREGGARSLLKLSLGIQGRELEVQGELLRTAENFWSGRTPPSVPPTTVVALSVPIDEPVRILAQTPPSAPVTPPSKLEHASWGRVEGILLALRVADVDGKGKPEVLALTDRALVLFSADGKVLASHELEGSRAVIAPRLPFGVLAVTGAPARIVFRVAQKDRAEALIWDERSARFSAVAVDASLGWGLSMGALKVGFVSGQTLLDAAVVSANGEAWTLSGPWSSAASAGKAPNAPVYFVLGSGAIEKRGEAGTAPAGLRSGAGFGFADLDGDGQLEVLVTSPEAEPMPETLRVLSFPQLVPMAQWEMPGLVRHIATGDLDGDGVDEALIGVSRSANGTTLELVKRGAP